MSHNGSGDNLHYAPFQEAWNLVLLDHETEKIIKLPYSLSEFLYRTRFNDVEDSFNDFSKCIWPDGAQSPIFVPKKRRS